MNPKVLLLTVSDQREHLLNKYPGIDLHVNNTLKSWELGFREITSHFLTYDFYQKYVNEGIVKVNQEIIVLIEKERPDFLVWPAMTFEILEETFAVARSLGCRAIGVFFDDILCFDHLTKFYIPYLDYFITIDSPASRKRYSAVGAEAIFMPFPVSQKIFMNKQLPFQHDVSFVGAKIANRAEFIDKIRNVEIHVQAFGRGWSNGYISTQEMVDLFNHSKINLNFVQSIDNTGSKQLKGRIFEICMCGGFLLTEYMDELKDCFVIDKEIVCFNSSEEAIDKIKFYLKNEQLRLDIAKAGYEKARNYYSFEKAWSSLFTKIDSGSLKPNHIKSVELSGEAKNCRSSWHIAMANALYLEGKASISKDEFILARRNNPFNRQVILLSICYQIPHFLGAFVLLFVEKVIYRLRKAKSLIRGYVFARK